MADLMWPPLLMARGTCLRHGHLMRDMILTPTRLLYRAPRLTCGRKEGAGVFSLKKGPAFEYCHRTNLPGRNKNDIWQTDNLQVVATGYG